MKTRKNAGKKFQPYNSLIEQLAAQSQQLEDRMVLPEILVITTYPPRQCGIATYSQDLIKALNDHYVGSTLKYVLSKISTKGILMMTRR